MRDFVTMPNAAPAPDAAPGPIPRPVITIAPTRGWAALNLGDLWRYRELLFILAGRDVRLRYKQTVLGVLWVVLQPAAATLVFAIVFGRLARVPSDGAPYALFAFAGVVAWNFLAGAIGRGGNSLVGQSNLITKVYFPRVVIPLSSTVAVLVDLAVALFVLLAVLAADGRPPTLRLVALPYFALLILGVAAGASLWLSSLSVFWRDFSHTTPFLVQIWMYATPVVYPVSLVPSRWRGVFALNPMVTGVEGFRWCLLGTGAVDLRMILVSTATAAALLASGFVFFRRVERTFADVI